MRGIGKPLAFAAAPQPNEVAFFNCLHLRRHFSCPFRPAPFRRWHTAGYSECRTTTSRSATQRCCCVLACWNKTRKQWVVSIGNLRPDGLKCGLEARNQVHQQSNIGTAVGNQRDDEWQVIDVHDHAIVEKGGDVLVLAQRELRSLPFQPLAKVSKSSLAVRVAAGLTCSATTAKEALKDLLYFSSSAELSCAAGARARKWNATGERPRNKKMRGHKPTFEQRNAIFVRGPQSLEGQGLGEVNSQKSPIEKFCKKAQNGTSSQKPSKEPSHRSLACICICKQRQASCNKH